MLVLWREENHRTRRKTLEQDENPGREPTTNSTGKQPACGTELKLKPRPHWWEASVLTTAPSLLPRTSSQYVEYFLILSSLFYFKAGVLKSDQVQSIRQQVYDLMEKLRFVEIFQRVKKGRPLNSEFAHCCALLLTVEL